MTAGVSAQGDRWRLYGLVLAEGARRIARPAVEGVARATLFAARPPDRLLVAPQDLRTADPTVAADIYGGHFAFAGRVVETRGRSPFQIAPPTAAWAETLNGFIWLRHLKAADTAIARANARALVDEFLSQGADRAGTAARPGVAARRLISFLTQSPLVLDGADHASYRRFMRALARGATQLTRALSAGLRGDDRLLAAVALAFAGLCLNGAQTTLARANQLLAEELANQVLPDGGHVSRDPRALVDFLTDLLPLRQIYAARGLAPPAALISAIDRMMPMLRLFRHGDGALAHFNGMGATQPDLLATLLAYGDARGQPIEHAPYSGYERMRAGAILVIAEVGAPPPVVFSRRAHAGCLSFEMSVGTAPMVVNCGAPSFAGEGATLAARSTAAHSTATVDDFSSCHFAVAGAGDAIGARLGSWIGPAILSGPTEVTAKRGRESGGLTLVAAHDGYKRRFGVLHERCWRLDASGERLEGADRFSRVGRPRPSVRVTLRFHLHPSVTASLAGDGGAVILTLAGGDDWAFEAPELAPKLDESIFFASPDGLRRTRQIVILAEVEDETTLRWRFVRLDRSPETGARAQ